MFPEELPKRLIKMFSFVGDTVLDPFLGSGTTCLAAKNLGRNSIGYEINEDFLPVIKERLNTKSRQEDFEIITQKKRGINYKDEILKLPYAFKDPVRFDKKIDPKKLQFGSKIFVPHPPPVGPVWAKVEELKAKLAANNIKKIKKILEDNLGMFITCVCLNYTYPKVKSKPGLRRLVMILLVRRGLDGTRRKIHFRYC